MNEKIEIESIMNVSYTEKNDENQSKKRKGIEVNLMDDSDDDDIK